MMKPTTLISHSRRGKLSPRELAQVVESLKRGVPAGEEYPLLHALGRSGRKEHTSLVETFLERPENPMISRLALTILCDYWERTEQYLNVVLQFVRGVEWDCDRDVQLVAISILGEYLREHIEAAHLEKLLRIYDNEKEETIVREASYHAIGRALGHSWEELPRPSRHFDLSKDVDSTILAKARQLALMNQG